MNATAVNPLQNLTRLESFLAADPGNPGLLTEAVHAALQAGLPERARTMLEHADPAQAETAQRRHLESTLLLAERQYAQARAILQGLRDEGLDASGILFNLGYAQLRCGSAADAAGSLAPLMARDDAPEATLAYLMRSHHHAGSAADAVAAWEAAPARFKTPEATAVAALACLDLDRIDDARRLADDALARGAGASEALIARATVAIGDGDEERAAQLLAKARSAAPEDGRVLSTAGIALMAKGDMAGAEHLLRQAVALMPQHVGTWHALAWTQLAAGRLDDARETFSAALAIDRNFGETHGGMAVVSALQGRIDEARIEIERAQRLGRDGMTYRYAQALLSGDAGNAAAVRALALRTLRRNESAAKLKLIDKLDI